MGGGRRRRWRRQWRCLARRLPSCALFYGIIACAWLACERGHARLHLRAHRAGDRLRFAYVRGQHRTHWCSPVSVGSAKRRNSTGGASPTAWRLKTLRWSAIAKSDA